MADLDSVVGSALSDAGALGGDDGGGESGGGEPAAESGTPAPAAAESTPAPAGDPAATPLEDLDAELTALGMPPVRGKDNRIPHSRVQKLVKKAEEKARAALEGELNPKLTAAEQKAKMLDDIEAFAERDPEGYIRHLATARPEKFKRFLQAQAEAAAPAQVKAEDDPMPGPDAEDGYSQAGLVKLLEWNGRQTERRVQAEYAKRFGPIEESWKAEQTSRAMAPVVRQQRESFDRTYGKELVDKHQSEIVAAMTADSERAQRTGTALTPVDTIVAGILVPKIKDMGVADRNKMREELLAEMRARPAAASAAAPGAASVAPAKGSQSLDDVVRAAVSAIR